MTGGLRRGLGLFYRATPLFRRASSTGGLPNGIGLCGHGWESPSGGEVRILRRLYEPPSQRGWVHGRRATLRISTGGGGNRGIARYYRNFPEHPAAHGLQRDRARKPMASREAGNGGIGSPPVRGHRQNFTKALRAAGRPPVASVRRARPLWRPWAAGCTME